MASKLLTTVTLLLFLVSLSQAQSYYWRRFNGTIPTDAVIGCLNFGYNVYLGRGLIINTGLFVGPIIPGRKMMVVNTHDTTQIIYDNMEILCTQNFAKISWTSTNSTSVQSVPRLIDGGFYSGDLRCKMFVGKLNLNSQECAIGHVNQIHDNLFYYNDRGSVASSSEFDVLTAYDYN